MIYLAYGSNLHLGQMALRCPTAKPIGTATLNGYKLVFRGNSWGGVANVEPDENSSVPVLLWAIKPNDEKALDRYEGYPHLYTKITETVDLHGDPVEAMLYVMTDGHRICPPTFSYFETIRQGYEMNGFDCGPLVDARADTALVR